MNLLIGVSIVFGVVGVLLAAMVVRIAKLEKQLEKVKQKVLLHDVILDQDDDPMKNYGSLPGEKI